MVQGRQSPELRFDPIKTFILSVRQTYVSGLHFRAWLAPSTTDTNIISAKEHRLTGSIHPPPTNLSAITHEELSIPIPPGSPCVKLTAPLRQVGHRGHK